MRQERWKKMRGETGVATLDAPTVQMMGNISIPKNPMLARMMGKGPKLVCTSFLPS